MSHMGKDKGTIFCLLLSKWVIRFSKNNKTKQYKKQENQNTFSVCWGMLCSQTTLGSHFSQFSFTLRGSWGLKSGFWAWAINKSHHPLSPFYILHNLLPLRRSSPHKWCTCYKKGSFFLLESFSHRIYTTLDAVWWDACRVTNLQNPRFSSNIIIRDWSHQEVSKGREVTIKPGLEPSSPKISSFNPEKEVMIFKYPLLPYQWHCFKNVFRYECKSMVSAVFLKVSNVFMLLCSSL